MNKFGYVFCVLHKHCFLTPAVATICLDSQLFCEQVSFPISQSSKIPRPGRDLLSESQNQVRSKTQHEDEVTSQQDIWRVMILKAGLLVLLIEILAAVSLCLQSWLAPEHGQETMEISDIWQSQQW